MYNWQYPNWGIFEFEDKAIDHLISQLTINLGEIKGLSTSLSTEKQQETLINLMVSEAQKTSEIEGEFFNRQDLISSIKKNLGIHEDKSFIRNKNAQNIANLMIEVRASFNQSLSEAMIKNWHRILMKNVRFIQAGEYRKGNEPMQIISGRLGKETIHYEAPPSERVLMEMKGFINWYKNFTVKTNEIKQIIIKTAISHLYFESIHPFEDGNGRIGRAIIEKCLSDHIGYPLYISVSLAIERDKKNYYAQLNKASKTLIITDWIVYFAELIISAQEKTKEIITLTIDKSNLLEKHNNNLYNRQLKIILKMFDWKINSIATYDSEVLNTGISAKKYMSITKVSKATATRDLQDLVSKQILCPIGQGRSTMYKIKGNNL